MKLREPDWHLLWGNLGSDRPLTEYVESPRPVGREEYETGSRIDVIPLDELERGENYLGRFPIGHIYEGAREVEIRMRDIYRGFLRPLTGVFVVEFSPVTAEGLVCDVTAWSRISRDGQLFNSVVAASTDQGYFLPRRQLHLEIT